MTNEELNLERAEQQLTGFIHAKRGGDLTSLVDCMGLTQKEWEKLQEDYTIGYLHDEEIEEINQYFYGNLKD